MGVFVGLVQVYLFSERPWAMTYSRIVSGTTNGKWAYAELGG